MTKRVADKGWNLDDIVGYIKAHGADVEEDNFGNIVVYPNLHEAKDGTLREGTKNEEGSNGG